jgi:histidine phosphotransferase ChpT
LWIELLKRFLNQVWLGSLMLSPREQYPSFVSGTNPDNISKSQHTMHELDLGALLVSRVCHDLISPVAAISNGLEILADEDDAVMKAHAMRLIEHSVGQAKARLLFARLAFGAMGSAGAEIDLQEVGQVALDFFRTGKAKLDWQMPPIAIDKEIIRVILNLAALGADCIPRGGSLVVKGEQVKNTFQASITAKGLKANLAPDIKEGLALQIPQEDLTGRTIAPFVTALLAQKIGSEIRYSIVDDTVKFEARFERNVAA